RARLHQRPPRRAGGAQARAGRDGGRRARPGRGGRRAARDRDSRVPAEIPVIRLSEALIIAGAPPDEPDLAPAHGMPPHGGFAIDLERWTGRLTQAENIRDVTLFPRDRHRLTP